MSLSAQIIPVQTEEEVETLLPLFRAQLEEHDLPVNEAGIQEVCLKMIRDSRYGIIFKAIQREQVVGVAFAASHLSVEHGGTIAWLEELYVLPEARGRGIGGALLQALIEWGRSAGWRGIQLEVVKGHERVISLYERYDFFLLDRDVFCRKIL